MNVSIILAIRFEFQFVRLLGALLYARSLEIELVQDASIPFTLQPLLSTLSHLLFKHAINL
jgi:hypothetical protein